MIHQVAFDKPLVDEHGISDPVILFDEDGRLHIAQWRKYKVAQAHGMKETGHWFEIVDGETQTYGDKGMQWWSEIELPRGYNYDDEYYNIYPVDEDGKKALALLRQSQAIDIDKVMADIKKTIESV